MIALLCWLPLAWLIPVWFRIRTVKAYVERLIEDFHDLSLRKIDALGREGLRTLNANCFDGYERDYARLHPKLEHEINAAWVWAWKLWLPKSALEAPGKALIEETRIRFGVSEPVNIYQGKATA